MKYMRARQGHRIKITARAAGAGYSDIAIVWRIRVIHPLLRCIASEIGGCAFEQLDLSIHEGKCVYR